MGNVMSTSFDKFSDQEINERKGLIILLLEEIMFHTLVGNVIQYEKQYLEIFGNKGESQAGFKGDSPNNYLLPQLKVGFLMNSF